MTGCATGRSRDRSPDRNHSRSYQSRKILDGNRTGSCQSHPPGVKSPVVTGPWNTRLDTITKKMDVHLSDVASSLKALKKGQADIATSHRMLLSEFEKSHDSVADAIGRIESYLDTIPADEYTGTMTYQQFKETDEDDEDNDPQQGGDNDQPADQSKDNAGEPPETENNGGEGTTNHLTPTQSQRGSAHNSRAPSPAARNSRAGSPATGATGHPARQ